MHHRFGHPESPATAELTRVPAKPFRKPLREFLLVASLLWLGAGSGCSTVDSTGPGTSVGYLQAHHTLEVQAHAEDASLSRLVRDLAFAQFRDVLPLREQGPFTGTVRIEFSSVARTDTLGTASPSPEVRPYGAGGYARGAGEAAPTPRTAPDPAQVWLESVMTMTVADTKGRRFWHASGRYNGGVERTGFTVKSAEGTVPVLIQRLHDRFKQDFMVR